MARDLYFNELNTVTIDTHRQIVERFTDKLHHDAITEED